MLLGLGLVGWGWLVVVWGGGLRWSMVGCAFGFGVGGLRLVGRGHSPIHPRTIFAGQTGPYHIARHALLPVFDLYLNPPS